MYTGFFSWLLKAPIQAREMEGEGRYLEQRQSRRELESLGGPARHGELGLKEACAEVWLQVSPVKKP